MPRKGFEPLWENSHCALNAARLPIPPPRLDYGFSLLQAGLFVKLPCAESHGPHVSTLTMVRELYHQGPGNANRSALCQCRFPIEIRAGPSVAQQPGPDPLSCRYEKAPGELPGAFCFFGPSRNRIREPPLAYLLQSGLPYRRNCSGNVGGCGPGERTRRCGRRQSCRRLRALVASRHCLTPLPQPGGVALPHGRERSPQRLPAA